MDQITAWNSQNLTAKHYFSSLNDADSINKSSAIRANPSGQTRKSEFTLLSTEHLKHLIFFLLYLISKVLNPYLSHVLFSSYNHI